jgi:hypothetical protein
MPLTPYLSEAAFDPQAVEVMNSAFVALCNTLQLTNREDPMTEIVARKVIDIGRTGERDPKTIHDLVLLALRDSDQRSA